MLEVAEGARESEPEVVLPNARWLWHVPERKIDCLEHHRPRLSHSCGQDGRPTQPQARQQ